MDEDIKNFDYKRKKELLNFLLDFITPHKKELFDNIIINRTRYLTVVLEDIFQPHNANAVLRTCECLGVQDVHIIENNNQYVKKPSVAVGSEKWLSIYKYNRKKENTITTFNALRNQGYRIVAATPHENDFLLENLPIDQKIALVMGTELNGLSKIALNNADTFVRIPMRGFTESYNISVSAAIMLYDLTNRIRISNNIKWELNEQEIIEIKLNWAKKVVNRSEILERSFLNG